MSYKSCEVLKKMYIAENKSMREIADHFNVSPGTINYHLNKNNIKSRKISEAMKIKHKNDRQYHKTTVSNRMTGNKKGFVYLMKAVDNNFKDGFNPVKIGVSLKPLQRKMHFETKMFFDIKILHKIKCKNPYELEERLHKKFSDKNIKGEWFNLDKDDINNIKRSG